MHIRVKMKFIRKLLKIIGLVLVSVAVLLSVLPYFFSTETKELKPNEKPFSNSNFIIINKTLIHYRVWVPAGKVMHKVFLIHGFSGSTFSYRNNIDTLVDLGALVIAMDLPLVSAIKVIRQTILPIIRLKPLTKSFLYTILLVSGSLYLWGTPWVLL